MAIHRERRIANGRRNTIDLRAGYDFHGHQLNEALHEALGLSELRVPRPILLAHNSKNHIELGDVSPISLPLHALFEQGSFQMGKPAVALSFGEIVGLGGDFYARFDDKDPYTGRRMKEQADDVDGVVRQTLSAADDVKNALLLMKDQTSRVFNADSAHKNGEGLVQAALKSDLKRMWQRDEINAARADVDRFAKHEIRYLALALENWDHFHPYALDRYRALHQQAITEAKAAGATMQHGDMLRFASPGRPELLKGVWNKLMLPLAKCAFACHFLTDALSSGHLYGKRKTDYDAERSATNVEKDGNRHDYEANRVVYERFGVRIRAFEIVAGGKASEVHDQRGNDGVNVVSKAHVSAKTKKQIPFLIMGDGRLPPIRGELGNLDKNLDEPNQVVDLVNAVRSAVQEVLDAFTDGLDPWGVANVPAPKLLSAEDYVGHVPDGSCGCPRP